MSLMGWRIRRVLNYGPFRGTLSRSGVGWSVGIPGLRYGVSATGRSYVSVGFPGLGLYWMKYLGPVQVPQGSPSTTNPSFPSTVSPTQAQTPPQAQPGPIEPWWKQKQ